ncbi:MAG: hypothetical protein AAFP78_14185, partial [Pseudomonadota bacterium]
MSELMNATGRLAAAVAALENALAAERRSADEAARALTEAKAAELAATQRATQSDGELEAARRDAAEAKAA